MTRRINWNRAKRPNSTEASFAGIILKDGTRVAAPKRDSLAQRAHEEARRWAETLSVRDRLSVPAASPYDVSAKKYRDRELPKELIKSKRFAKRKKPQI